MRTSLRLGSYALGLVVVLTAALGAGSLTAPPAPPDRDPHAQAGHAVATGAQSGPAGVPAGLQITEDGYRLQTLSPALTTGRPRPFLFRILGPGGEPVTGYTESHDRDLHLIVVRRDLTGFQHLHPVLAADGTWSVPLAVPAAGQYRVFADFRPAGHERGLTLGADVPALGDHQLRPLPAPARTATVDGYTVTLDGALVPGSSSELSLSVARNGVPVTDLQPYLGAYGHLVALREGDLAYLHVHPDGAPGDGRTAAGPRVTFHAEVPSDGRYRLYLDFRHAGTVRTAEFTAIAGTSAATPPAPAPPAASGGHDTTDHTHE